MVQFSVCYIFILRSTVIINIDCQLIMNFTLIRTISLSLQRSLLGEVIFLAKFIDDRSLAGNCTER